MPDSATWAGAKVSASQVRAPWSQVCGVPESGYIGPACGCARCPVGSLWLRTKAHMGSSKGVPVCIHVSGCVRVWLFFLALMGKMKSESSIELGSASFLCLGLKPPEPGVGNSF